MSIYSPDVFCFKIQLRTDAPKAPNFNPFESVGDVQKVAGTPCTVK